LIENPATDDYTGQEQSIIIENGAMVSAQGNAYEPVVFTSTLTSGDRLGNNGTNIDRPIVGRNPLFETAIYVTGTSAEQESKIRYCQVNGANIALYIDKPLAFALSDCFLFLNETGIKNYSNEHIEIFNNLLLNNESAGIYAKGNFSIINNTMDNCGNGIRFCTVTGSQNYRIWNNIITNSKNAGIWHFDGPSIDEPTGVSNNTFYQRVNISSVSGLKHQNSQFQPPGFIAREDSYRLYERYFLKQGTPGEEPKSCCVDTGYGGDSDKEILAYKTTSRKTLESTEGLTGDALEQAVIEINNSLDFYAIDRGYHYPPYGKNPIHGFISVSPNGKYFEHEDGTAFVPIGGNEGISWGTFNGIWRLTRDTIPSNVEAYFYFLKSKGVNTIRIFGEDAFIPKDYPTSPWNPKFYENEITDPCDKDKITNPKSVNFWEDFFNLAEIYEIKVVISLWDTYWINKSWDKDNYPKPEFQDEGTNYYHPYKIICNNDKTNFIKVSTLDCNNPEYNPCYLSQRRRFKDWIKKWGHHSAILGWEIMNEIDCALGDYSLKTPEDELEWINEITKFIKEEESKNFCRNHLLTVSYCAFGGLPWSATEEYYIYWHPDLDFSTTHNYTNKINYPEPGSNNDVVSPALEMNQRIKIHLSKIVDNRPYFDSETGPYGYYQDKGNLPMCFDKEYFRNIQWAHFCSGGTGSAYRWPYCDNCWGGYTKFEGNQYTFWGHLIIGEMRDLQEVLGKFIDSGGINFANFPLSNIDDKISINSPENIHTIGCGDKFQAIIWLLRDYTYWSNSNYRCIEPGQPVTNASITISNMADIKFKLEFWNTSTGEIIHCLITNELTNISLPSFYKDLAIKIYPVNN